MVCANIKASVIICVLKWNTKKDRFDVEPESPKQKYNNNFKYRCPNAEYAGVNLLFGLLAGVLFINFLILIIVLF